MKAWWRYKEHESCESSGFQRIIETTHTCTTSTFTIYPAQLIRYGHLSPWYPSWSSTSFYHKCTFAFHSSRFGFRYHCTIEWKTRTSGCYTASRWSRSFGSSYFTRGEWVYVCYHEGAMKAHHNGSSASSLLPRNSRWVMQGTRYPSRIFSWF